MRIQLSADAERFRQVLVKWSEPAQIVPRCRLMAAMQIPIGTDVLAADAWIVARRIGSDSDRAGVA